MFLTKLIIGFFKVRENCTRLVSLKKKKKKMRKQKTKFSIQGVVLLRHQGRVRTRDGRREREREGEERWSD